MQWCQWDAPQRVSAPKSGNLGPGASPSTCCWLTMCFQFSFCQLEAKGWAKSPQAVLHPHARGITIIG